MPSVLPAAGSLSVFLTVAAVATRPAMPKEIPVVTATWPNKLNQPVSLAKKADQRGGASNAAQKYKPPLVGMADTISAMAVATSMVQNDTKIHPTDMTGSGQGRQLARSSGGIWAACVNC